MSDLSKSQSELAELFRQVTSLEGNAAAKETAERVATGNARLTPLMQLEIYREQFVMRHVDVLRDDFQALVHFLGDEAFETLAKAYLRGFPPSSFTLRDLGSYLDAFVACESPWSDDRLLLDLVRVDLAFVVAFDAPDGPKLDREAVAAVPEDAWPSARLVLQPALKLVQLSHAAHDYRIAVRNGELPLLRPEKRPCWLVVFRGPESLQCLEIAPDAWSLLERLAMGTSIGDACEQVVARTGESEAAFEAKVGAWFQEWTALGWLSRVEL